MARYLYAYKVINHTTIYSARTEPKYDLRTTTPSHIQTIQRITSTPPLLHYPTTKPRLATTIQTRARLARTIQYPHTYSPFHPVTPLNIPTTALIITSPSPLPTGGIGKERETQRTAPSASKVKLSNELATTHRLKKTSSKKEHLHSTPTKHAIQLHQLNAAPRSQRLHRTLDARRRVSPR